MQVAPPATVDQLTLLVDIICLLRRAPGPKVKRKLLEDALTHHERLKATASSAAIAASSAAATTDAKGTAKPKAPAPGPAKAPPPAADNNGPTGAAHQSAQRGQNGLVWPQMDVTFWSKVEQLLDCRAGLVLTANEAFVAWYSSVMGATMPALQCATARR